MNLDLEDLAGRVTAQRLFASDTGNAALYLTLGKTLDLIAEARFLRSALSETGSALLQQMGELEEYEGAGP